MVPDGFLLGFLIGFGGALAGVVVLVADATLALFHFDETVDPGGGGGVRVAVGQLHGPGAPRCLLADGVPRSLVREHVISDLWGKEGPKRREGDGDEERETETKRLRDRDEELSFRFRTPFVARLRGPRFHKSAVELPTAPKSRTGESETSNLTVVEILIGNERFGGRSLFVPILPRRSCGLQRNRPRVLR